MRYHLTMREDGEPVAHVEVSAPEVQTIFSALHVYATEHRERIGRMIADGEDIGERALDAIGDNGAHVGVWNLLDTELSEVWWEWMDELYAGDSAVNLDKHSEREINDAVNGQEDE